MLNVRENGGRTRRLAAGVAFTAALVLAMSTVQPDPALAAGRCATSAGGVEQRIASFWQCVGSLGGSDTLLAEDLGGWAQNVIERDPAACIRVTDFKASTAAMQGALDVASAGVTALPPKTADVEDRIARFWQRVNALGASDSLAATDVGQWALNVIDRDPSRRIRVDDFRASTAGMQGAFDAARAAGASCKPTAVATPAPAPTPSPTPSPTPKPSATPLPPVSQAWGVSYNAPGTRLDLVELERRRAPDGTTEVMYDVVAVGMPKTGYDLWQRKLGRAPERLAGPFTPDDTGTIGAVLAVHLYSGEPLEMALVTADAKLRVFGRVVPFPFPVSGSGQCVLSTELASGAGDTLIVIGSKYRSGGEVNVVAQNSGRTWPTTFTASADGSWLLVLQPAGLSWGESGLLTLTVTAAGCSHSTGLRWGSAVRVYQ